MRGITARESKDILDMAEALVSGSDVHENSIKTLERATMIRAWGSMASETARLGFSRVNLGSSRGEPALTVDRFEDITRIIHAQPEHYRIALISVYQNGRSITTLAKKLGVSRHRVERWVWHGLERVDAALNTVIRVAVKTR